MYFQFQPSLPSLLFSISAPVILAFLLLLFRSKQSTGLRYYPLIGNLPQYVKNRSRLVDWITEILAASPTNTATVKRIGKRLVLTANPANVEYIVKSNFDNYHKGLRVTSFLRDFLGHGIFNSDGDHWRVQRKTASYEFTTKSLRNFVVASVDTEIVTRLLPLLRRTAVASTTIDLQDVLERFAFDNICRIAFDVDPACLTDGSADEFNGNKLPASFSEAFHDAANLSAERFRYAFPSLWKVKKMLGIGSERRLAESIAMVHDFATMIIRSRKKEREEGSLSGTACHRDDLLSRFLAIDDNSDEYLRDMVVSILLAGRDTTSSSLSWFFWLLSRRPDVESKILDEIRAVRSSNPTLGETFSYDELKEMPYLHAALSESMRLYPAVTASGTTCMADDVLPDGTEVKKGSLMSYSSYSVGRMEAIWGKDCKDYKPERWLDDDGVFQPVSPYKYPVFHGGPRMCLGKETAYLQMKAIVACVLERFEIDVVEKMRRPEMTMSLTLRMKHGLPVRVKEKGTRARKY